ncbi:MAG: hypothetical protein KBD66_02235 [Candidatus Doudnabacteria bacterium]|nr:hypothetical protein [Candidatus Doudnabacteria bacterium]
MRLAIFVMCLLVGVFLSTSPVIQTLGVALAEQVFRPVYVCTQPGAGDLACQAPSYQASNGSIYDRMYTAAGTRIPAIVYGVLQLLGLFLVIYGSLGVVNVFVTWHRGRKELYWYW